MQDMLNKVFFKILTLHLNIKPFYVYCAFCTNTKKNLTNKFWNNAEARTRKQEECVQKNVLTKGRQSFSNNECNKMQKAKKENKSSGMSRTKRNAQKHIA